MSWITRLFYGKLGYDDECKCMKKGFQATGWSYITCDTCGHTMKDPARNAIGHEKVFNRMADQWGKDEINSKLIKKGRFKHLI